MPDTTHVANATRYNIWAQCDTDRTYITESSEKISRSFSENYKKIHSHEDSGNASVTMGPFSGSASGKHSESNHNEHGQSGSSERQSAFKQLMQHVAKSTGFTLIKPGSYLPFATNGPMVYVSIYIEAGRDQFQYVCTAYPIARDRSVIVGSDGQVRLQKYGAGAFIDENGHDHYHGWRNTNNMEFGIKGSNGRFVCGENGQAPVICNRDSLQDWETFEMVILQGGYVALKSMGKYLSSENGQRPMTCNRLGVGNWETFLMVANPDGTFSLCGNNGKYVSSEHGRGPMMCNRSKVEDWEKFVKISRVDNKQITDKTGECSIQ